MPRNYSIEKACNCGKCLKCRDDKWVVKNAAGAVVGTRTGRIAARTLCGAMEDALVLAQDTNLIVGMTI
jgi:hypothetical protein